MRLTTLSGLTLVLIGAAAEAFDFAEDVQRLSTEARWPGLAAALVVADRPATVVALGEASKGRPWQIDTPFAIGDYTMVMSAVMALRLEAQGRWSVDDALADHLPELRLSGISGSPPIRIIDLLSHHSGMAMANFHGLWQLPSASVEGGSQTYRQTQPSGLFYGYSYLGYEALREAMEARTGVRYRVLFERELVEPMALQETGFDDPEAVSGHRKRRPLPAYRVRDLAALGAQMSIRDLARSLQVLNGDLSGDGRLLSAADVERLVADYSRPMDLDNQTGLGWQLTNTGRHRVARVARSNFAVPGLRGVILWAIDERLAVVLVANDADAGRPLYEAARGLFDHALEAEFGIEPPAPDDRLLPPAKIELRAPAVAGDLADAYATPIGLIRPTPGPGRFDFQLLGLGLRAKERPDGWYRVRYQLLGVLPLSLGILDELLLRPAQVDGRQLLVAWFQGQQLVLGSAVATAEAPPLWRDRAGDYDLLNPDLASQQWQLRRVKLVAGDAGLTIRFEIPLGLIRLRPELAVEALDDKRLRIAGIGSNLGDAIDYDVATRTLEFSGYRFAAR